MTVIRMPMDEKELLEKIGRTLKELDGREERLLEVCRILDREVPHYNWTGFYLVDPEEEGMLRLGPFVGAPTEHVLIPFGQGICGQAAATGEVFLIDDVSEESNYLSCSPDVRSEIVLPIFRDGELIGELDIDSHDRSAFSSWDSIFLQKVCDLVSSFI